MNCLLLYLEVSNRDMVIYLCLQTFFVSMFLFVLLVSQKLSFFLKMFTLAHSTVIAKSEKRVDHVLIQPFLLYYINYVVLMLTSTEKPLLSGHLRDLPKGPLNRGL